jgi:hypothetical protein
VTDIESYKDQADLLRAEFGSVRSLLKKSPEGRAILECAAHDVKITSRTGLWNEIEILQYNLASFILGKEIHFAPTNDQNHIEALLERHPVGKTILAARDAKARGMHAEVNLVSLMADHVAKHGKQIVASSEGAKYRSTVEDASIGHSFVTVPPTAKLLADTLAVMEQRYERQENRRAIEVIYNRKATELGTENLSDSDKIKALTTAAAVFRYSHTGDGWAEERARYAEIEAMGTPLYGFESSAPASSKPIQQIMDTELEHAKKLDSRDGRKTLAPLTMAQPAENAAAHEQVAFYEHLIFNDRPNEAAIWYARRKTKMFT